MADGFWRRCWHPVLTGGLVVLLIVLIVSGKRDWNRAQENRREFAAGALRLIERGRGAELAGMLEAIELPLWQAGLRLPEYTRCYRQAVAGLLEKRDGR